MHVYESLVGSVFSKKKLTKNKSLFFVRYIYGKTTYSGEVAMGPCGHNCIHFF